MSLKAKQDITSYTIAAISPTLKLEESCVGIGKTTFYLIDHN